MPLAPGRVVGRYVILGRLGQGAMGVVHAAFDPDLDRKVALKVLRPGARGRDDEAARMRLLREAQALAKLDHPNVVTVHDVGTVDGQVFVAMEFVEGRTLSAHLAGRRLRVGEVLDLMIPAGRALAAAHRRGIVHRDFKPDNVMVRTDGRVLVMDFGLSRAVGAVEPAPETVTATTSSGGSVLASDLTQAGAVMGTPAYMAPEQFEGADVDGRADQFAFCVTLWEALYGERPFAGRTLAELAFAASQGALRRPPRGVRVPRWLRRILRRGLAPRPEDRFPDMDALVAALEGGRRRARLSAAAVGAGTIAALGMGVVAYGHVDHARRVAACEARRLEATSMWNETTRDAVHRALASVDVPYAAPTAETVTAYLDRATSDLAEATVEVCNRASVDQTWTPATAERARVCLDGVRTRIAYVVEQFQRPSAAVVGRAPTVAGNLVGIADECLHEASLAGLADVGDASHRRALREIEAALAEAWGRFELGDAAGARSVAERAVALARDEGAGSLTARARSLLGWIEAHLGEGEAAQRELVGAYFDAAAARAWVEAGKAATDMAFVVGERGQRRDDGLDWARHARVAFDLAGIPEEDLRRAYLQNVVGMIEAGRGRISAGRAALEDAADRYAAIVGPDHPSTMLAIENLGTVEARAGDYGAARRHLERVLEVWRRVYGDRHPKVADVLGNLAVVLRRSGDHEGALRAHDEAIAIYEGLPSPDPVVLATLVNNRGVVHGESGRFAAAVRDFERAYRLRREAFGEHHPSVAITASNLAEMALEAGDVDGARAWAQRAIEGFGGDGPSADPLSIHSWTVLAKVERSAGRLEEARRAAARAVEVAAQREVRPELAAEARFTHAQMVAALGSRRNERAAVEEARAALASLEGAQGGAKLRSEIAAWLEARRGAKTAADRSGPIEGRPSTDE